MEERIAIAGFGGQGVMAIGQLLTYAGMENDYFISWYPSYGPEMRGGTANCSVVIADEPVGSPVVEHADVVIVMNRPSLDKFESKVKPGGKLFVHSNIVDRDVIRDDIDVYKIPAGDIANGLNNPRVQNMVMLGAYLENSNRISLEDVLSVFTKVFGEDKKDLLDINKKAMQAGMSVASTQH